MNSIEIPVNRLDRPIALFIAAQGVLLLSWAAAAGFSLDFKSAALPGLAVLGLAGISVCYTRYRPDPRIASATKAMAQLTAMTIVGAPLSYIAASLNWPLLDSYFDLFDRSIGISWENYFHWVIGMPWLLAMLRFAYETFLPAVALIVNVLAMTDRHRHLSVFVASFLLMTFLTIIFSGVLPATNPYNFHGYVQALHPGIDISATTEHIDTLFALRDGTLRNLTLDNTLGIITFPSLHGAAGIAFILALWPVPWLRWPGLIYGITVIASTPVCGSHYIIDVIAGIAIACLSFAFFMWWSRKSSSAAALISKDAIVLIE